MHSTIVDSDMNTSQLRNTIKKNEGAYLGVSECQTMLRFLSTTPRIELYSDAHCFRKLDLAHEAGVEGVRVR